MCRKLVIHQQDGDKFFLIVVDDYSCITWIFFLKFKGNVVTIFPSFLKMIHTQLCGIVHAIRYDNGGKFVNSVMQDLCQSMGIVHQKTNAESSVSIDANVSPHIFNDIEAGTKSSFPTTTDIIPAPLRRSQRDN